MTTTTPRRKTTRAKARPRWLEYVPLDDLIGDDRNPKAHDLEGLEASLGRFGYTEPVVMDERTGKLVAGHGRRDLLLARRAAGGAVPEGVVVEGDVWLVPVNRGWSSKDDTEAGAYLITANRLTEKGGWVKDPLAQLLEEVAASDLGLDGVGYTKDDLDVLLAQLAAADQAANGSTGNGAADDDDDEEPPADPVTQRGDIWHVGPHRIMCGDSRDPADMARLLDGATINLAFTSPPYADRREYDESSGFVPIPPEEYVEWFEPVAGNVCDNLADDGSWFVNIRAGCEGLDKETYVLDLVLAHVRLWGWHWVDELCWERPGIPRHVAYRFKNAWESVHHFARGVFKFRPEAVRTLSASVPVAGTDALGIVGNGNEWQGTPARTAKRRKQGQAGYSTARHQGTNSAPGEYIIEGLAYPSNRLPTFSGSHEALGHAAAFPIGLPEWFVRAYTDLGDHVFDPFTGTGSTVIAAHNQGRVGYGMEVSRGYVDLTLRRIEAATGLVPVLESTGVAHSFV